MSYGIAPRFFASDATSFAGTKMNSGWGSMKRDTNHGHAMRSTRARSRVIHFMVVVLLKVGQKPMAVTRRRRTMPSTAPPATILSGARRHSSSAVTAQAKIMPENGSTTACGASRTSVTASTPMMPATIPCSAAFAQPRVRTRSNTGNSANIISNDGAGEPQRLVADVGRQHDRRPRRQLAKGEPIDELLRRQPAELVDELVL